MRKKILLLGSTGSIGRSSLNIIRNYKSKLEIVALSTNKNIRLIIKQSIEFKVKNLIINDFESYKKVLQYGLNKNIRIFNNISDFLKNNKKKFDVTIVGISGFDGLEPTLKVIPYSKNLSSANKESIICGWKFINNKLKKYKSNFIPLDSEHFSIWSLVRNSNHEMISKIYLTASGGPFLNKSKNKIRNARISDVIKHPNWDMGSKIPIDSATLVNKCLELIEAKYLFDLEESIFDLVIHPQSIVHSVVTYKDGSSICQMSMPDMRVPIAHALSNEHRLPINFENINFNDLNLSFHAFPEDRLQIQKIAREVCNSGGHLGTIFNAANEVAVESFLNDQISFDKIYEVIHRTFDNNSMSKDVSIESIYEADTQTRIKAKKVVKSIT